MGSDRVESMRAPMTRVAEGTIRKKKMLDGRR